MSTFLAIFNVIAGMASILGLFYIFMSEDRVKFKPVAYIGFGIALLISGYILFVPGSYFENSVKSKVLTYSKEESDSILVQRGEVSFGGLREYEVMFPEPFKSTPEVEMVNVNGYDHGPYIQSATPFKIVLKRSSSGPTLIPESFQTFIWVARGEPMTAK
ncbi:hypothetical protein [Vibrio jasicida]|uniref:hypothetical protein n=1 Tax=Vibrio jasicida TaxID=766224 RepID=UPI0003A90AF3|nr:hypothetical protein [Vibrio jasicida]